MIRHIVAALLACLGLGIALPAVAESPPELADRFDCATCHTERLREFRRRGAVARATLWVVLLAPWADR